MTNVHKGVSPYLTIIQTPLATKLRLKGGIFMNNFNIDTSILRQAKINGVVINVMFSIISYIHMYRPTELKEVLR